ncbi:M48 family metallopeptidase [candidate division KSB1 bacterium]
MITAEAFKSEVTEWAEKIKVSPKEIHLRSMKKKWASCSSKGRLTFDKKILNEPEKKRSEIIVHELLHLRYPSHSKMFKTMLKSYLR